MTAPVFQFKPESANSLVEEVMERSGQKLTACYQCRRCAAGCPVGEETGYVTPDRLIRMIAMGDRDNAFNNELVWRCVSCYTCGTRCPNEIQTSRITETLKKMGQESYIKPLRHKVAYFHKSFINAGIRWGRVNEIEFMSFYELKNTLKEAFRLNFKGIYKEAIAQTKLGLTMLKKKRMHFGLQSAKGRDEIKHLYKKARKTRG